MQRTELVYYDDFMTHKKIKVKYISKIIWYYIKQNKEWVVLRTKPTHTNYISIIKMSKCLKVIMSKLTFNTVIIFATSSVDWYIKFP